MSTITLYDIIFVVKKIWQEWNTNKYRCESIRYDNDYVDIVHHLLYLNACIGCWSNWEFIVPELNLRKSNIMLDYNLFQTKLVPWVISNLMIKEWWTKNLKKIIISWPSPNPKLSAHTARKSDTRNSFAFVRYRTSDIRYGMVP